MRGFIREVLTITGVVGGMAAAYFWAPMLKPHMRGWFGVEEGVEPEHLFGVVPYDTLADVLSYGLIFIIVVAILSFVSHSLAEFARRIGLGAVDRSLGFLFGLVRGIVLLGLIYLLPYTFFDKEKRDEFMVDSKSQVYLEKVSAAMASYLPEGVEEKAEEAMKQGESAMDTRKKLQDIKLLKRDDAPADSQEDLTNQNDNPNGYSDEFRDEMDELINKKSGIENE